MKTTGRRQTNAVDDRRPTTRPVAEKGNRNEDFAQIKRAKGKRLGTPQPAADNPIQRAYDMGRKVGADAIVIKRDKKTRRP